MNSHFRSSGTCLGLVLFAAFFVQAQPPGGSNDDAWAELPAKSKKNPALPADNFKFVPPKGADVVGS